MKLREFYPYWRYNLQETALDKASERGLQLEKAGVFSSQYRMDDAQVYRHCIVLCEAPKGSASRLQAELAWKRAGWEKVCDRGKLQYYRCPADAKVSPWKDNDFPAFLNRKTHALERTRIWLLVLSVLCIVLGYAVDEYMIVRASVIPLSIALIQTLILSKMQKALSYGRKE